MRKNSRLQKALYLVMAGLGVYILYKGGKLLAGTQAVETVLDDGNVQRSLEDAAVRTYMPGLAASVEGAEDGSLLSKWMSQVAPVYSYLAEHSRDTEGQALEEAYRSSAWDDGSAEPGSQEAQSESVSGEPGSQEAQPGSAPGEPGPQEAQSGSVSGEPGSQEAQSGSAEPGSQEAQPEAAEAGGREMRNDPAEEGREESGTQTGIMQKDAGDESGERRNRTGLPGETSPDYEGAEAPGTERGTAGAEPGAADREVSEAGEGQGAAASEPGAVSVEASEAGKGQDAAASEPDEAREVFGRSVSQDILREVLDYDTLLSNYFTVDSGTCADQELLDGEMLLSWDLGIEKNPEVPQILIYHTHSQEAFADSVPGEEGDTIVGMGEELARILREEYGYQVLHDTGSYDLAEGVLDRSAAYDYARKAVSQILEEYPTIEVVIDLHRDGVDGQKFVTEIDGKPCSMIMFFNGLSRDSQDEPISYLPNPYTEQNLAFSLQLELKAREQYPGFTRNIYLKAERFNLHLRPRSLLIEAGTQMNTVEEERNAMTPLAELLDQVLSGR